MCVCGGGGDLAWDTIIPLQKVQSGYNLDQLANLQTATHRDLAPLPWCGDA